jgi:hypothetical protein
MKTKAEYEASGWHFYQDVAGYYYASNCLVTVQARAEERLFELIQKWDCPEGCPGLIH